MQIGVTALEPRGHVWFYVSLGGESRQFLFWIND